jgi:hypothetical protein
MQYSLPERYAQSAVHHTQETRLNELICINRIVERDQALSPLLKPHQPEQLVLLERAAFFCLFRTQTIELIDSNDPARPAGRNTRGLPAE